MRLRGGWGQPWVALQAKAWERSGSFPWSGSSANPIKPAVAADRKKVRRRVAVAVGADIGHFEMPETRFPIRTRRRIRCALPVLTLLLASVTLGGCSGGDFGRTPEDFR